MVDTHKKIKMIVTMDVTIPQALALQAMYEYMNQLGGQGASRDVGFFANGDGNFQPRAEFTFSEQIPELTEELRAKAVREDDHGDRVYDFDSIAWAIGDR